MLKDVKKLFSEYKYEEASILCRQLLSSNDKNSDYWYYLFLSDNKDYVEFDENNLNNEIAFNKALELADDKKKNEYIIEYNFYKHISRFKGLNLLFKYAQYNKIIDLYEIFNDISNNPNVKDVLNDYEYIYEYINYYSYNFYLEDINICKLVVNYLCYVLGFGDIYVNNYKENMYNSIYEIRNKLVVYYDDSLKELVNENDINDFEIKNNILVSYKGKSKRVIIPNEIIEIGVNAFKDNDYIVEVVLGKNVKKISCEAFGYCENLKKVILNDALECIEKQAFTFCTNLDHITIPSNVKIIDVLTFNACSNMKRIVLSENIEIIKEYAFNGCDSLLSIVLPKTLSKIETSAFSCPKLVEVYNYSDLDIKKYTNTAIYIHDKDEPSKLIYTEDGYVFAESEDDKYILIDYVGNEKIVYLPKDYNGFEYTICQNAFSGNENIIKVIIPEGIKRLENGTFSCCYNLLSVYIPESIQYIDEFCFTSCYSLFELYGLSNILEDIELADKPKIIHNNSIDNSLLLFDDDFVFGCVDNEWFMFRYIGLLSDIELPKTINGNIYSLSNSCFEGSNIRGIIMPRLINIEQRAFYNCKYLSKVIINGDVDKIRDSVFAECLSLESITINGNVNAFVTNDDGYITSVINNCPNLEEIIINGNVGIIERSTISECESIKRIIFNGNVDYIGEIYLYNEHYENENLITVGEVEEFVINGKVEEMGFIDGNIKKVYIESVGKCEGFGYTDNSDIYLGEGPEVLSDARFLNTPVTITLNKKIKKINFKIDDIVNIDKMVKKIYFKGNIKDWNKIKFNDSTLFGSKTSKKLLEIVKFI